MFHPGLGRLFRLRCFRRLSATGGGFLQECIELRRRVALEELVRILAVRQSHGEHVEAFTLKPQRHARRCLATGIIAVHHQVDRLRLVLPEELQVLLR